ncbi:MAG: putative sulfate exporter family transporter [Deltaproteobacteria bacterium]|nr:putative sulfate exporter family transporter [Deltaproteobacteria bacterium]
MKLVFLTLLLVVALPFVSPPFALVLGVGFGLLGRHPYSSGSKKASKLLLQASVVALGFAMDLEQVIAAGRSGFGYTFLGIAFALALGHTLGRALKVQPRASYLISVGTAICGGSAIAAVAPVVEATEEEISVSLGTVFLLNAFGLLLFPPAGRALGLDENQFGLWAALAIHDTSSVVGAGAKVGAVALTVATTVKLARALWIVPLTLLTAAAVNRNLGEARKKARVQWPWFILLFLGAAVLSTYVPSCAPVYPYLSKAGRVGLTVTLFLIGSGMSVANLKRVGIRPLVQGVLLWIIVGAASLLVIRTGLVSIG